ncbi:MAG TPA: metallophosphoesterase [Polyangiaceae bacterium LLY-WYZ-15_(1-7)]|nr:metallophosphoesterase [Polyangiaceae bacterium LLY-WYZ-15_(1-7)]HJL11621.1 metallophosphoesterase [Polyangiaceae bacterium LLY-WYZ-15_(1-7)]HJL21457.1 metallophosphoesterase [Polyangiaceae bacterium LLY-WYZ-15_(1-7)]HJL38577.1 metallophosphoesterase [Polyangiaceae bacterium LLY-WYZ-15_(1-7)]HJL47147.1 metallophosphoesterase [Polyangiaceae bacterium LLY-WYZ-15_(1-7)]
MRSPRPLLFALALAASVAAPASFAAPAAAQPKGPWWIDVHEGGARLMAEVAEAGELELVLTAPDGTTTRFASEGGPGPDGGVLHALRVTGLAPDTLYAGQVTAPGLEAAVTLHTAPEAATEEAGDLSFLVYGDDRTGHAVHRRLVARMREEEGARFVVHTGDYVEVGGRPGDWQTFFEIAGPLLRDVPIYPSLGNHEIYGPGGRMRYQRYFVKPSLRVAFQAWTHGPVKLIALDSNDEWTEDAEQLHWLEEQLAHARDEPGVRFVIVFAHQGPLSSGRHGDHPGMSSLGVAEILRQAEVDLVFSGHDHMYERGDFRGLKYVVTGGGGAPLYRVNRARPSQLAFQPVHHYVRIDVEGKRLAMTVVRPSGDVLERCGFEQGGPWECERAAPIDPGEEPGRPWWFWALVGAGLVGLSLVARWRRRRGAG